MTAAPDVAALSQADALAVVAEVAGVAADALTAEDRRELAAVLAGLAAPCRPLPGPLDRGLHCIAAALVVGLVASP